MSMTRIVTGLLALLLATAGAGMAQSSVHGTLTGTANDASAVGDALVAVDDDGASSFDASALGSVPDAGTTLGLDASGGTSGLDDAKEGGYWGWLKVGFGAFVNTMRDLVGLGSGDASADASGSLDVSLSQEGVDVGLELDNVGAGVGADLDGVTLDAGATSQASAVVSGGVSG